MNKIAVRLPNWLGDTVMAVPALVALRATWPQAEVLAAGPWAPLLAGQELAEVLLTYPRADGARLRAADAVARFGPELALVLPNSFEAALAAWYSGARRRVGFGRGGRSWLLTDTVDCPEPRPHQIDEYLLLSEHAGAATAVVSHAVPCAPCFYRVCPIEHPCLRGVQAGAVYERVLALVEERRGSPTALHV